MESVEWKKAKKKPIIIDYREVNGEVEIIRTREGKIEGYKGKDFIIKGVDGELYPIKKNIFYKTYDIEEKNDVITCPKCGYVMLRKDMKLFGNKCIKCGYCIACDSV